MIRGTTPTHIFTLPEKLRDVPFSAIYVTYTQSGRVILERDDATREGLKISVTLTQAETMLFRTSRAKVQVTVKVGRDTVLSCKPIQFTVTDSARNEVIE